MPYVLIVDDEELVRELFKDWLREAGYVVDVAASAAEARARMEQQMPDVLVSDIRMAQETGIDLLTWTREQDPDLPVILVTGVPAVETAVEALRRQAYDYLVKPINEDTLRRVVARALEHRRLLQEKRRLEEENQRYRQHLEKLVAERTATLERRTQQLLLLHRIAHAIGRLQDEDSLYQQVVSLVQEAFGYTSVALFEVDPMAGLFHLRADASANMNHFPEGYTQPIESGLIGRAFREGRALVINNVHEEPEFIPCPGINVQSEAIFPIRVGDTIVAILNIDEERENAFDEADEMLLHTLAGYVGVAIANARLYNDLQEALKAREEMFNNVSHELRTPLTIIRGYAELLLEGVLGTLGEEGEEALQAILQQAKHLTYLVNQLVAFRVIEREGIPLSPVDFGEWLRHTVSAWQPALEQAGLSLEVDIPADLGTIMGNTDFLQQVVNNLLDNARKFSPEGGTVRVRAWHDDENVYVSVSDEGVGVPPEKLDRIFDRFYQVNGGTTRKFGGMGLGLALVREIITRHNGRVWARSGGLGKGLTITFTLPRVSAV